MRSWTFLVFAGGFLFLAVFSGCSGEGAPPRAGDTVKPRLAGGELSWVAGQSGELSVRLEARNKDGSPARWLGFAGIPMDADPVARIVFYQGQEPRAPVEVRLSHRC